MKESPIAITKNVWFVRWMNRLSFTYQHAACVIETVRLKNKLLMVIELARKDL